MASKLDTILAARKSQMQTSKQQHLIGLRTGQELDSDDDDDSGDQPVPNGAAAQPTELLLSRAENLLRDPSAATRKKTLASLEEAELSADQLKPLLRSLLLRFSDDAERCRDGAVGLFRRWQSQCADASEVSGCLMFLMPVMVERLGSEKVQEPAEEVRAALVMLMRDVLLRCKRLMRPYISEVGAIALGCARDNHPEVIKGLCELVAVISAEVLKPLCKETSSKQIKPFSQKLIDALLPHITHRHGAVRLQVLGALEELLLCGAGQSVETLTGWRLKNNVPIAEFYGKGAPRVNYLADLSRDRQVSVRRKFMRVIARWVREMDGEDLYEQEVRIMPYLVTGLCDDDDETCEISRIELERLGKEYLDKNMKDYKERIEYGWRDDEAYTRSLTIPMPKPLKARPPLGARERVKQHFRCLIHPICAELESWTGKERLQSARLLEMLLVYSEDGVTEFMHQLLPALAKSMDGGELKGLQDTIGRCCALLAQHIEPDEYLPLLCGHANSDALNPLTQRVANVQLIPHLLTGVKPPQKAAALRGLYPLLADRPSVCTQHTLLRAAMRAALDHLISLAATLTPEASPPLAAIAPMLLHACVTHLASSPLLQPKVTSLGDGLEDITDADEAAWQASAATAMAMAAPLNALAVVRAGGGSPWVTWRKQVVGALVRDEADADDDYATIARKLVENYLKPEDVGVAAAPIKAAGGVADGEGVARRAIVIDEGDFSSDEEEEPPADKPPAADKPAGGYDQFDDELD